MSMRNPQNQRPTIAWAPRVLIAGLMLITSVLALAAPASAAPTWHETSYKSCSSESVHNAVGGTQNLSSYLDGWTSTWYSNPTVVRVGYWNSPSSSFMSTRRGINQVGIFAANLSYAYCA